MQVAFKAQGASAQSSANGKKDNRKMTGELSGNCVRAIGKGKGEKRQLKMNRRTIVFARAIAIESLERERERAGKTLMKSIDMRGERKGKGRGE